MSTTPNTKQDGAPAVACTELLCGRWLKRGKLFIPVKQEPDPEAERRRKRYEQDPEFRRQADKTHHSRLMSGPACDGCMRMVENREHKPNTRKP